MVGLFYGLDVDYASLLWEEFGNSISHSKLANGVSSARFWGLILREVYTQENVLFLTDVDTPKFPSMTVPKVMVDDVMLFPMVARIYDSMLKLINHTHQMLIQYQALLYSTQNGFLQPKATSIGAEGSSKSYKGKKK